MKRSQSRGCLVENDNNNNLIQYSEKKEGNMSHNLEKEILFHYIDRDWNLLPRQNL